MDVVHGEAAASADRAARPDRTTHLAPPPLARRWKKDESGAVDFREPPLIAARR